MTSIRPVAAPLLALAALPALLMFVALQGCSTGASNTIDVGIGTGEPSRVTINSSGLKRRIAFGNVVTRQEGLLQRGQVALENRTGGTLAFEYRWEWTDADGFQMGDTLSSWQPGIINGKERKMMSSVGPGPRAVNFRLYLREPTN
ncbi:MAG: YcfL family protein [Candidatus Binatia bacterium]